MTFRNPDAPVIPPQGYTYNPYTGCYEPVRDMRMFPPRKEQTAPVASAAPSPYTVKGRWIRNPDEVLPRDIPEDGSVALFPLADFSQIIAKAWKSDGTIEEVRYIPEQIRKPQEPDSVQAILGQLAQHGQALDQIMEMLAPKKAAKKEAPHE